MVRSDLLTGILAGVILGLVFTAQLAPYLSMIVILAVLFGMKVIGFRK